MSKESWSQFVSRLDRATHRKLLIELGGGLRQARMATEVAVQDGLVEEARGHLRLAILHMSDALDILDPDPRVTDDGHEPGTEYGGALD